MKIGIMQPYFLPYIGYFQLINSLDRFIVYDNIKYTKKGWINRNRMLQHGEPLLFTLPLKDGSDFLDIRQRELAADFNPKKLLNQFSGAYGKAPFFKSTFQLIEEIVLYSERNLFGYLHHSIVTMCRHLAIETPIVVSSTIPVDGALRNQGLVIALCKANSARTYINAIGGTELYSRETFQAHGINLRFIKPKPFTYLQFGDAFVPWLSIVDVLMFNSLKTVRGYLTHYELM